MRILPGRHAAWRTTGAAVAIAITACLGGSCRGTPPDETGVAAAVLARLQEFERAERSLDPDRVLAFLAPDFAMFQDGERVGRDATVAQIRTVMPSLRAFDASFEDVQVIVLGADAALTSMTFRDTITAADGATTTMRGPSTLLWRRRDGVWSIVFADSDHYPDDPR